MPEDPNPDTGPLAMDKDGLQRFLDDRVLPFSRELDRIVVDDPSFGPTMATLIGDSDILTDEQFDAYEMGKPLAIGFMSLPESLGGKGQELNKGIAMAAESVVQIYDQQIKLFADIEDNLRDTIETLLDTQNANLIDIDGQEFLDVFEDVDESLADSGSPDD